jgi:hypothetical protein
MASSKTVLEECTIWRQEPLVLNLFKPGGCKYSHPKYYTSLYDENGKLIDDGIDLDNERSYYEFFVDESTAEEVERRLEIVEHPDYIPGTEHWIDMEVYTDGEDYEE